MAFELTERSKAVLDSRVIEPQLLVDIEGYPNLITSAEIKETLLYGLPNAFYGDPELVYGGGIPIDGQEPFITLNGTTTQLTQQLLQDEGSSSSTQQMVVAIVNKDNRFANLFTTTVESDILSKKCTLWLGAAGMNYPDDFIKVFVGNITEVNTAPGLITIRISHPEGIKRQEILIKSQTELADNPLTVGATTINVDSTVGFETPGTLFRTFVRIDDELIEYTGLTATSFTGCTRGALGSVAIPHDQGASVDSFYLVGDATAQSNAIDLALKVMLSGSGNQGAIDVTEVFASSVRVDGVKIKTNLGMQVGDTITTAGSAVPTNNGTFTVIGIVEDFVGTTVSIAGALTPEVTTSMTFSFKSQFDVMPIGLGLKSDQVDVPEFLRVKELFLSTLPYYEIRVFDSISGKDLLNREILFPAACFSIPRKGQISVTKVKPPLAENILKVIDEATVLNASSVRVKRSSLENFYNAIVYRYEPNVLDDSRFLAGRVLTSATSFNRVKVGNKPYLIESKGLVRNPTNQTAIANNAARLLDRFQFGAEGLENVELPFSVGWNMEIGDTVLVKGLQVLDQKTQEIGLKPALYEVTGRSFSFKTGKITVDLLNTNFSTDGRYGVVSPTSIVDAGSTATQVRVKKSFNTGEFELERDKWEGLEGFLVRVHSADFSESGEAEFLGFSASDDSVMLLGPGLAFAPGEGYYVNIVPYDTAADELKAQFVFFNPEREVVSAASQTEITVDVGSDFFVGSIIRVHSPNYVSQSSEVQVTAIVGNVLTLGAALGYLPSAGDKVQLIGFASDEGLPYRIF